MEFYSIVIFLLNETSIKISGELAGTGHVALASR